MAPGLPKGEHSGKPGPYQGFNMGLKWTDTREIGERAVRALRLAEPADGAIHGHAQSGFWTSKTSGQSRVEQKILKPSKWREYDEWQDSTEIAGVN